MRVLCLQGPILKRLGQRDPYYYPPDTLADIARQIDDAAAELGCTVQHFQSNSEGELIDWVQAHQKQADAIIANPAGLTNYGISLRDALWETGAHLAVGHLSNLLAREEWRRHDVFAEIAHVYFAGSQGRGYVYALQSLHARFQAQQAASASRSTEASRDGLAVVSGVRWSEMSFAPQ